VSCDRGASNAIAARGSRLSGAARLDACHFADETGYLAACLPEDDRRRLTRLARQLDQEQIALATQTRETADQFATERQKAITDQPRALLAETLSELTARHGDLQQETGGLRQTLTDNATRRLQQADRAQAIEREGARMRALGAAA
jgi:exonuclease SbcC